VKRATLRDLHLNTSSLVREASEGQTVVIVKHGVPVAELRAFSASRSGKSLPDRAKLLARFPRVKGDSGKFLEEDRS